MLFVAILLVMVESIGGLVKKKGFVYTILYLNSQQDCCATERNYFEHLEEASDMYYNAWLRVKPIMLDLGLVKYSLSDHGLKVLNLTTRGKKIAENWLEIEKLLNEQTQ